jgi:hypothetical protein
VSAVLDAVSLFSKEIDTHAGKKRSETNVNSTTTTTTVHQTEILLAQKRQ